MKDLRKIKTIYDIDINHMIMHKRQFYNVGSGTSYTITEISRKIANLLNKKIRICYDESIRKQDINEMVADITKVSKEFDWKPKIDINQGLILTIKKSKEKENNN